jgi:hypothetical protein
MIPVAHLVGPLRTRRRAFVVKQFFEFVLPVQKNEAVASTVSLALDNESSSPQHTPRTSLYPKQ